VCSGSTEAGSATFDQPNHRLHPRRAEPVVHRPYRGTPPRRSSRPTDPPTTRTATAPAPPPTGPAPTSVGGQSNGPHLTAPARAPRADPPRVARIANIPPQGADQVVGKLVPLGLVCSSRLRRARLLDQANVGVTVTTKIRENSAYPLSNRRWWSWNGQAPSRSQNSALTRANHHQDSAILLNGRPPARRSKSACPSRARRSKPFSSRATSRR